MGSCLMEESICLSRYWRLKLCSFTWEVWLISLRSFTCYNFRCWYCWTHMGCFSPSVAFHTLFQLILTSWRATCMFYCPLIMSKLTFIQTRNSCSSSHERLDLWSFSKHILVNIKQLSEFTPRLSSIGIYCLIVVIHLRRKGQNVFKEMID